jgi:hypothetical protein
LILNQSLKERLLNLKVVNIQAIVETLLEELKQNQSVITLAGV